jgi:hypothetical protein
MLTPSLGYCSVIFTALVVFLHNNAPKVQLTGTTIIGKSLRVRTSNLDFFGGHSHIMPPLDPHLTTHVQVSLLPNLRLPVFVLPPLNPNSPLHPYDHSRPAVMVSNVCNLQVPLIAPHF